VEGFGDADDFPVPGLIGEGCGSALGAVEVMGFAGLGGGAAPRVSVKPCSAASAGGAVSATST
jgi:hypothetical protein